MLRNVVFLVLSFVVLFYQQSFAKVDIQAEPDIVVFDVTQVGDRSNTKVVKIYNRGDSKTYIIDVKILGDDKDDFDIVDEDCKLEDLKEDQYCSIEVVFEPESKGTKSALLSVLTVNGVEEVPLTGIATTNVALSVDPTSHDFGKVDTDDSKSISIKLKNKGLKRIEVTRMKLEIDDDNFELDEDGGTDPCKTKTPTLDPGESCTVELTFKPDDTGFKFTILKIKYDTTDDSDLYAGGVYYGKGTDNGGDDDDDDSIDIGCSFGGAPTLPAYLLVPVLLYLRRKLKV